MKKNFNFNNLDEKTMNEVYQKTIKTVQFQEKINETNKLFQQIALPKTIGNK